MRGSGTIMSDCVYRDNGVRPSPGAARQLRERRGERESGLLFECCCGRDGHAPVSARPRAQKRDYAENLEKERPVLCSSVAVAGDGHSPECARLGRSNAIVQCDAGKQ